MRPSPRRPRSRAHVALVPDDGREHIGVTHDDGPERRAASSSSSSIWRQAISSKSGLRHRWSTPCSSVKRRPYSGTRTGSEPVGDVVSEGRRSSRLGADDHDSRQYQARAGRGQHGPTAPTRPIGSRGRKVRESSVEANEARRDTRRGGPHTLARDDDVDRAVMLRQPVDAYRPRARHAALVGVVAAQIGSRHHIGRAKLPQPPSRLVRRSARPRYRRRRRPYPIRRVRPRAVSGGVADVERPELSEDDRRSNRFM